jgi:putative pre-16S rRNA nuclease
MVEQKKRPIMGLDYGSVRIGIAVSDPDGMLALPKTTLQRTNIKDDLAAIHKLVNETGVGAIVVGYPKTLSGKTGPAALSVQDFVLHLREVIPDIQVKKWDERLTTAQSEKEMIGMGMKRKRRRKVIDQSAAMHILQSYLDCPTNRK